MPVPRGIFVVVATMRSYATAREKIRDSLLAAGWPLTQVIWVYGKEPNAQEGVNWDPRGGYSVSVQENLYEMNAFLGAADWSDTLRLPAASTVQFVLLHDTSWVGPRFATAVERLCTGPQHTDIIWLSANGQCNICIFNVAAARASRKFWAGTRVISKQRAIAWEWNTDPASPKRLPVRHAFTTKPAAHISRGRPAFSGSSNQRVVIYFEAIDLYKAYVHVDQNHQHPEAP